MVLSLLCSFPLKAFGRGAGSKFVVLVIAGQIYHRRSLPFMFDINLLMCVRCVGPDDHVNSACRHAYGSALSSSILGYFISVLSDSLARPNHKSGITYRPPQRPQRARASAGIDKRRTRKMQLGERKTSTRGVRCACPHADRGHIPRRPPTDLLPE